MLLFERFDSKLLLCRHDPSTRSGGAVDTAKVEALAAAEVYPCRSDVITQPVHLSLWEFLTARCCRCRVSDASGRGAEAKRSFALGACGAGASRGGKSDS
eukprot:SAG31_NODE_9103_length_1334_cov_0.944939_2_plen_100_part_00